MRRTHLVLVLAVIPWFGGVGFAGTADTCRSVESPNHDIIKVIDKAGKVTISQRAGIADLCPPLKPTSSVPQSTETVIHTDADLGIVVDENGIISALDGSPSDLNAGLAGVVESSSSPVVIDWMTTTGGFTSSYSPGGTLRIVGRAQTYYLSDGSNWNSGAGTYTQAFVSLDRVEASGVTVRYVLFPPSDGVLYRQTDYNSGNHSAQGTLGVAGPLEMEATIGSNTAVLRGVAEILSNDATWYGEPRFNYYSSIVGSLIPFEVTYTLTSGTWTENTFDSSFSYRYSGVVDFANPVSVPTVVELSIAGSAQVPGGSSSPYVAVARFGNDILSNVTAEAIWDVEPATLASIEQGILTTQEIDTEEEILTIHAEYTKDGVLVETDKTVVVVAGGSADLPWAWEMYQGDHRHSGLAPIPVEPDVFSLRWQRVVGAGNALNPVTAADGKVFVSLLSYFNSAASLFVLDDRDGETIWSKSFDDPFSVNPPSYAYGNLYIQTGNHGSDTYLHAFDADTGDPIFRSPHSAQWERYYAPTIHQGSVFVNGGYYGGMYAFDAFSGQQLWFRNLPQYDEWTPALDENLAYSYVGGSLFALDRMTGNTEYTIADPGFQWQGWSMDLAPVLGGMNDVLAIHDGRLVSFDLQSRSIRYELDENFRDQPAVAAGVVYAINQDTLVAVDQETGNELWSWSSNDGLLSGNLVLTDTHVFATTADNLYAIELLSHSDVWSYPVSGHLSLSDEILYVASSGGLLTAINMPEYTPASLDRIEISGPTTAPEFSTAQYTATAYYDDGRVRDRTELTEWNVERTTYASIDSYGLMTITELLQPSARVRLSAVYTEGGVTRTAFMSVALQISVTIEEFIRRNINAAMTLKLELISELEMALLREHAARTAAEGWIAGEFGENLSACTTWQCLAHLDQAISLENKSQGYLEISVVELLQFLEILDAVGLVSPLRTPAQQLPEKRTKETSRK